jgi:glucokinase
VLGVDCGGTTLRLASFAPGSLVPAERTGVPTPVAAADIASVIGDLAAGMFAGVGALGIAVAGLVDHRGGRLIWMPHTAGGDVAIAAPLAERFGVSVVVDNDATAATLAEARHGSATGARFVLGVFLGTGIGGGIAIDGRPERGRAHLGEIGHMILDPSGPACACGNRGCWEAFVSGTALAREARALADSEPDGLTARLASGGSPRAEHLGAAAGGGDRAAAEILNRAGWWLGVGLGNLVALLDPDVVVLGGRLVLLGERLLGPARMVLRDGIEGAAYREETPLVPAFFGADAGLVGAALLAGEPP